MGEKCSKERKKQGKHFDTPLTTMIFCRGCFFSLFRSNSIAQCYSSAVQTELKGSIDR